MKFKIKFISLTLIMATMFASLISCSSMPLENSESGSDSGSYSGSSTTSILGNNGGNTNNNNNSNTSENNGTQSTGTEKLPANAYLLFQGGDYTVKAIMPDKPTDIENTVYAKLRSTIKNKTGKTLQTNTDYLTSGKTHSAADAEILVGLTNYDESKKVYSDITNGTYGIKFSGKKIIFYFSTVSEGLELVDAFCSAIQSNKDKAFWISNTFSLSKSLSFKLEGIPNYPTSTTSYNCSDDTTMLLAKSTNLNNFNSYCSTLTSNGFVEYSRRDNVNGNYFRTYTKGTMALTVYFSKRNSTVRIISGPLTDIPPKDTSAAKETNKTPSVTLLNQGTKSNGTQQGSGLGILFHLPNGKFIIYDGGYVANDGLYKTLQELAGNEEIIIAAWIVSHPHADHQDAFDAFLKNHAKDIEIETVMYNYTTLSDQYGDSATIRKSIKTYLDGKTTVIKPHTGQIYKFGSSTVEILYTIEDMMPDQPNDIINNSSMAVRVTVLDKSVILLGDVLKEAAKILTDTYGSYLKADMVQLAHHGSWPGTETLYSNINASVVFWPSNADNAKNRYNASDHASLRKAISIAKDVYLASEGTKTIKLPYTVQNNKSAFLSRLGLK